MSNGMPSIYKMEVFFLIHIICMYIICIKVIRLPMLIIKHTVVTTAPAVAIWQVWQDVANWNTWDYGIEFSSINGPFKEGTSGTLKPKGGPLVHTKLTHVEPMKAFVDESKLPFARIIVSHFLKEKEGKIEVTHKIEMKGLLAFLFAYLIGRTMKKNLPEEMEAMVKKAENLNETSSLEKDLSI